MPPHLHPRSSATTTLFASTLAASFIIVGIPHIFPCPAPRKGYLDENGRVPPRRRSSRSNRSETDGVDVLGRAEQGPGRPIGTTTMKEDGHGQPGLDRESKSSLESAHSVSDSHASSMARLRAKEEEDGEEEAARTIFRQMKEEAVALERESRQCPVPKPTGKIGELLGFRDNRRRRTDEDER